MYLYFHLFIYTCMYFNVYIYHAAIKFSSDGD